MKSTQAKQTVQTHFVQKNNTLIAQNEHVHVQLSLTNPNMPFTPDGLSEETECNVLIRSQTSDTLQCFINGQNTTSLSFLQDGNTQWGRIPTGDRPGHITFRIQKNNTLVLQCELPIRPSKLDYENDYQTMRTDLQNISRSLVFALPQQAQLHTQITKEAGSPLDLIQYIKQQGNQLTQALHAILKRPHRQLTTHTHTRLISLATGRDPDALKHITHNPQHWTSKPAHKQKFSIQNISHLTETQRYPTTNTAINRHLISQLTQLTRRLRAMIHTPNTEPCHELNKRIQQILRHRTFQNIPRTQHHDTPPIHIDDRYQTAFTHLRNLNRALAPFEGGPFDLSYRDTPTLYEYWTWFTLIQTFCHLGFKPQVAKNLFHLTQRGIIISPTQGEPSAIQLQKNNTHLRCLYNPTYTTASGQSLTHDLRPDIVIELQHNKTRTVHAFDAKYRRENHNEYWIPLREDIDKMHAYRDAVGQVIQDDFQRLLKSAIVLFPAPNNNTYHKHTFYKSLPHGIGGIPLLPGHDQTQTELKSYLTQYILP